MKNIKVIKKKLQKYKFQIITLYISELQKLFCIYQQTIQTRLFKLIINISTKILIISILWILILFQSDQSIPQTIKVFVNYKLIKTQQQLFKKTYDFIQELRSIADGFQKEAIQNILSKLNTSLKVRRQKKSKFKEIPEQFAVYGVHATFEYRNTGNQKQPRQEEQVVKQNYQPELQILDKKTDAVKIPIQFDQQSGSYHQFSISDNVVSRNGGSSYQILHFKYRLSYKSRYTCTMRLIKTYRRVCWIGIMQQQTKNFIHTSKMQNCIVYHTCHGRIETHLKKQQGLEVKKKKARGMTTLYDSHWVRMLIQMDRWVKARCRIPDQLRGMSLRPVVILQIINDTVEFIDL